MELDEALFCSSSPIRDECDDVDTLSHANMEIGQALTSINSPFQTIQEMGAVDVLFVESSEVVNDYETARYVMLATNVCICIFNRNVFWCKFTCALFSTTVIFFLAIEKSLCISWSGGEGGGTYVQHGGKWVPTYLF